MDEDKNLENKKLYQYTVSHKAREESAKLWYDAFKHLTTISTGSILILVAFMEKLFMHPKWKAMVIVSFLSFVVSIVASVLNMTLLADQIAELETPPSALSNAEGWALVFGFGGFLIGVVSLIIFSTRNFYG